MMEKTVEMPSGDKVTYRIPNVIELLRFFGESKWYDADSIASYWLRLSRAVEAIGPFIVEIEGTCQCLQDLFSDRKNTDCLVDIAKDIAGVIKVVTEEEKKLLDSVPST